MKNIYIKREIENRVENYVKMFPALALLGTRQAGKTTLLKHKFLKGYKYINMDNPSDRLYAKNDPLGFLKDAGENIIIDEIQYVPELFSYIKIIIDENPSKKGRFIFTGSQNFLLMKQFSETLAGRLGIINMHPFSIFELFKKEKFDEVFYIFCLRGGYPALWIQKELKVNAWYDSYIQTYIERDVRTLYNVGNLDSFYKFIKILAARVGQILNLSSIATDTGVSVNTIKSWLSILQASYIIFMLYPYHKNIRSKLVKSPKIYFMDIGLVLYLNGIETKEQLKKSNYFGLVFENFLISEIVKLKDNYGLNIDISYFRNQYGIEIDLIIEKRDDKIIAEFKSASTVNYNDAIPIERFLKEYKEINFNYASIVSFFNERKKISNNVYAENYLNFLMYIKNNLK